MDEKVLVGARIWKYWKHLEDSFKLKVWSDMFDILLSNKVRIKLIQIKGNLVFTHRLLRTNISKFVWQNTFIATILTLSEND